MEERLLLTLQERIGVVERRFLHILRSLFLKLHSQLQQESATRFARALIDVGEVTPHIDRNLLADVQAQAMGISLVRIGTSGLEEPGLLLLGERLAHIFDQDVQSLDVVPQHGATNQLDCDLVIRLGKLNGVSDQVYNDLLHA